MSKDFIYLRKHMDRLYGRIKELKTEVARLRKLVGISDDLDVERYIWVKFDTNAGLRMPEQKDPSWINVKVEGERFKRFGEH